VSGARRLPPRFLLGCATAAHQVEGFLENDWSRWVRDDRSVIKDGSDATVAIDHVHRYADDLAQLGAMHHSAHRFSIEWARVEPEPGCIDREALRHYRDVVERCREARMEPIVTLQHFTLPLWLADRGSLLSTDAPRLFARYAAACAEAVGDRVHMWMTINEPSVLAVMGYLFGMWPPNRASAGAVRAALRTLLRMHVAASTAIRRVASLHGWEAQVSFAHHERPLLPAPGGGPLDAAAARIPDYLFNRWFIDSCVRGRMLPPVGRGEPLPGGRGSIDWLGVNQYSHDVVHFDTRSARTLFARIEADPTFPHTDFGWAIDPDGFRRTLLRLWQRYRLPMIVTENGVSDSDDSLRPRFIVDHLRALLDAVDAGADIRGYLHWTSWDNFEWAEGYSQHFGLIAVDRRTMERLPKPSATLYARICETQELPARV
jgi:beta-glucosidase